ncbi:MAG: late competence development ComFB family protein [Deltaproteobacteria bacterium]|jgi:competence protein ComFB|nr:late competence development ComFB family protein [Deltaproteobacteria bacterium]
MSYRNYMEDAVLNEYDNVVKEIEGICRCERCKEDMIAYTLNRMSAKYVVTDLGHAYTKLNQLKVQNRMDIVVQLIEASDIVRNNPRH